MASYSRKRTPWQRLRSLLVVLITTLLIGLFVLWRIDNPRVERLRMAIVDRFVPSMDWILTPVTQMSRMIADYRSYSAIYEQNQELRQELQRMQGWREAALQLEEKNAQLRALNNVRLDPSLAFVTAEVKTDSGGPFSQSALLNVGRLDGVENGQAAVDGLGLVGRIAGVAEATSRLLLITDVASQVPVVVRPSGQRAIVRGDNTGFPRLEFLENPDEVAPGSRVATTGDGGVFPPDLLVGQVVIDSQGVRRVRLAADFQGLQFIRVLRAGSLEMVDSPVGLIGVRPPSPEDAANDEGEEADLP